jgi:hypothetical protein
MTESKQTPWMKKLDEWYHNKGYPKCYALFNLLETRDSYLEANNLSLEAVKEQKHWDEIYRKTCEVIEKEKIPAYKERLSNPAAV